MNNTRRHVKATVIFLLLTGYIQSAVGQPSLISDGPYIFYQDGYKSIQTVQNGKSEVEGYQEQALTVRFNSQPDWNFQVRLGRELKQEPCEWNMPRRLFVVSDIEGEFKEFRRILIAGKVMDQHSHWIFGKGHLVIAGDLFDRGTQVVEELWLIYQLEMEAKARGGYVHTLLGNHDIMNLSGDLRYVDKKYFESAKQMGKDYMMLYDTNSELGRWLRTKNVIEKIGDKLFVHGGISPVINRLQLDIKGLNEAYRPYYDVARKKLPEEKRKLFGPDALFWYRGYFMVPRASLQTIDSTLYQYHCRQIVVGHTIIINRNPALYYNGKILGVDINRHKGDNNAVLIKRGKCYKIDNSGRKALLKYHAANDKITDKDID